MTCQFLLEWGVTGQVWKNTVTDIIERYCRTRATKLIQTTLFAKVQILCIHIKNRVVEGISRKRENIGVMTQHYKCIDGISTLS
jgi:hypothetical protein